MAYVCPRCNAVLDDLDDKTKSFKQAGETHCGTCGFTLGEEHAKRLTTSQRNEHDKEHRKWVNTVTWSFEGFWLVLIVLGALGGVIAKCAA